VKCVLMTNLGCSGAEVATQVNKLKWPQPQRLYSREREAYVTQKGRFSSFQRTGKPLNSDPTLHGTALLPSLGSGRGFLLRNMSPSLRTFCLRTTSRMVVRSRFLVSPIRHRIQTGHRNHPTTCRVR
jgi:hypothetical protein